MKRLKMPRIPTRIPIPDFPSIHRRSSREEHDTIEADAIQSAAADAAQDTKPAEQPNETGEKFEHRKVNFPKIPLPSLSKPSAPKLHAPNIPLPSISKPRAPKLSVPKIPLPSISIPSRSKKTSPEEETTQPETNENAVPIASSPAPVVTVANASGQTEVKPEPKGGMHRKISLPKMPSLHKAKEMPASKESPVSAAPEPQPAETKAPTEPSKAKGISGIHMPSFRKAKEKPETAAKTAPSPQLDKPSAPTKPSKAKGKPKISMPKFSMPSMSRGKGDAKPTGKRILAISIEGTDIRLLTYYNNSVETWKSVPFDARLLKMGQVADPVGLGEAIKNAVTDIETSRCYLVCSLPGLRAVSRIITVPNVGKKEMDSVIPREVRRTMTVSEEDNYFHWQALPVEAAQARVFVLAVPKEPLALLLQAFSNAGLRPSKIDLKPLSLMRAINQKDAIIANCEGNSMELVIVANDIPVLIRSVFLGEGVVNQDYAVGRISDELGRTIVTYNEINKERPLDQNIPIYLTGSAAAGTPFALNVAALTGRTVQPLEALLNCPAELPIAEYMVNIGLILKVV